MKPKEVNSRFWKKAFYVIMIIALPVNISLILYYNDQLNKMSIYNNEKIDKISILSKDIGMTEGLDKGIRDGLKQGIEIGKLKLLNSRYCEFSVGARTGVRYNIRILNVTLPDKQLSECQFLEEACTNEEGLKCKWDATNFRCACDISR